MGATDLPKKLYALLGAGLAYKAVAERADILTLSRIRNGRLSHPGDIAGIAIGAGRFDLKTGTREGGRAFTQAKFAPGEVVCEAGLWAQYHLEAQ